MQPILEMTLRAAELDLATPEGLSKTEAMRRCILSFVEDWDRIFTLNSQVTQGICMALDAVGGDFVTQMQNGYPLAPLGVQMIAGLARDARMLHILVSREENGEPLSASERTSLDALKAALEGAMGSQEEGQDGTDDEAPGGCP